MNGEERSKAPASKEIDDLLLNVVFDSRNATNPPELPPASAVQENLPVVEFQINLSVVALLQFTVGKPRPKKAETEA